MAETYCLAARWQDCVSLCQDILNTWSLSPHHFELLQTLFYLTHAYYWLHKKSQGYAATDEWTKQLTADTTHSQCVLLCTQGNKLRLQDKYEEAELLLDKAVQLGQLPSYILACGWRFLAEVSTSLGKPMKAEAAYLWSLEMFSTYYPKAYAFFFCLYELGWSYMESNRFSDAEKQFLQGKQLYSTHFPNSEGYIVCILGLGHLYKAMNRLGDAEQQLLQAFQLSFTPLQHSEVYADCLLEFGGFYFNCKNSSKAKQKLRIGA